MRQAAKRDIGEQEIVDALVKAGATVTKLSQAGVLDLLVGLRGTFYMIEVKGEKGQLTADQRAFIHYHDGCPMFIVRSPEEALSVLGLGIQYGVL